MHKTILRITGPTFYKHFSVEELFDIEAEAAQIRRDRSTRQRAAVLNALYTSATDGNVPAAKEFLDRTEGTVAQKNEHSVETEIIISRKTRDEEV